MQVEHTGDTVEAEAVEAILLDPKAAVGEQKMLHIQLAVVEAARVPGVVVAPVAVVKELVACAIELREPFHRVLDGMRVDDIHDDEEPHAVRDIDQLAQLVGGTEAGGGGKEVGDMVAERAVVGVFHDGHQLDRVVPGRLDARQDVLTELGVGPDPPPLLGHADVRFVDQQRGRTRRRGMAPLVGGGRRPGLGIEDGRDGILDHAPRVAGNAVAAAALPLHAQAVGIFMLQGIGGQMQLPVAALIEPLQGIGVALRPVREGTQQVDRGGVGGPLAEDPAAIAAMQAVVVVADGVVAQGPVLRQAGGGIVDPVPAALNARAKRL